MHGVARAGVATVFPQSIGLAATFDPELVGQIGDVVSTEGRAKFNEFSRRGDHGIYKGLTFWAPNVNIFRDPRWGPTQTFTNRSDNPGGSTLGNISNTKVAMPTVDIGLAQLAK